jgi:hypothetical protein
LSLFGRNNKKQGKCRIGEPMNVDPNSIWYIARDGENVWQGSASDMLLYIAAGEMQGSEAAWTDGFAAWLPVRSAEETGWIRDAVSEYDERSGEHTEFSNPSIQALHLPGGVDEGDSPFAGPRPRREQARRAKVEPQRSISTPMRALTGLVIVAGLAFLAFGPRRALQAKFSPDPPPAPAITAPVAPSAERPTPADAGEVIVDAQLGKKAVKETNVKPVAVAEPIVTAEPVAVAEPIVAAEPVAAAQPKPATEPVLKANAAKQIVRIVQKKAGKATVAMPDISADRDSEIKHSMTARRGVWDACVRRAQRDYPGLTGRLSFIISVTKDGNINGVTGPTGNAGAQYAAGCLLGEFSSLRFPPGAAAQVRFAYVTP